MLIVKGYGHTRVSSKVANPARPSSVKPTGAVLGALHRDDLLTLLSAVESATTRDLASAILVTPAYAATILVNLELEGRVEKIGRGVWQLG